MAEPAIGCKKSRFLPGSKQILARNSWPIASGLYKDGLIPKQDFRPAEDGV